MEAEGLRSALVAQLVDSGRIRSPSVADAFLAVPRHVFLPDTPLERAYADEAVATKWQDGTAISSASQPSMMAIMLEQLGLCPGHRVLEIGTGTGYNAALMSRLVGPTGSVVALDIDEDLTEGAAEHLAAAGARRVALVTRDGALGYPQAAPYDRIVLTVGSTDVQPAWWRQLAPGGRLLLPLSVRGSQLSVALDLATGHELRSASVRGCAFVRLRGVGAGSEPSRTVAEGLAVQAWRAFSPDALAALLQRPGAEDLPYPLRLTSTDLWDGVGLWLAVREPRACRLLVADSAEPHRDLSLLPEGMDGGTMALLGEHGLAVLVRRGARDATSPFPVVVRPFGPDGPACAGHLVARLREWEAIGRPDASRLGLRVRPREEGPAGAPASWATPLETAHTRLEIGWPANPVGSAPKLDR